MSNDDTYDLSKEKRNPLAQKLLRGFLNTDGPKGNNPDYDRGYEFNFRFSDEEKKAVLELMEKEGLLFADAFDKYKERK